MALDHKITTIACLADGYVTVVEGLVISWNLGNHFAMCSLVALGNCLTITYFRFP